MRERSKGPPENHEEPSTERDGPLIPYSDPDRGAQPQPSDPEEFQWPTRSLALPHRILEVKPPPGGNHPLSPPKAHLQEAQHKSFPRHEAKIKAGAQLMMLARLQEQQNEFGNSLAELRAELRLLSSQHQGFSQEILRGQNRNHEDSQRAAAINALRETRGMRCPFCRGPVPEGAPDPAPQL